MDMDSTPLEVSRASLTAVSFSCQRTEGADSLLATEAREQMYRKFVLLGDDAGALETVCQGFVLGADFVRQAIAEFLEELSGFS